MQTESPALFDFEPVERKKVVAGFDGGTITSDAGALLLATGSAAWMAPVSRIVGIRLLEHTVETLVGQRVGLALG